MHFFRTLLAVALITSLLGGCAAVVVTGAATGANAAHDRRTLGAYVDDEGIELKARLAITDDKDLYKVNVVGGVEIRLQASEGYRLALGAELGARLTSNMDKTTSYISVGLTTYF